MNDPDGDFRSQTAQQREARGQSTVRWRLTAWEQETAQGMGRLSAL